MRLFGGEEVGADRWGEMKCHICLLGTPTQKRSRSHLGLRPSLLHNIPQELGSAQITYPPKPLSKIGPLDDPGLWYKLSYAGPQNTQWDIQNKTTRISQALPSFVLNVPLRNLLPSMADFVPCDRVVHRTHLRLHLLLFAILADDKSRSRLMPHTVVYEGAAIFEFPVLKDDSLLIGWYSNLTHYFIFHILDSIFR